MNILLTSVGRRTYLINYFKEALNGGGKIFASNSMETYSLTQADEYVITPQIYDSGYIDFLIDYCKNKSITAIISLFDIDLPILAKNKSEFEKNGIKVVVSDENIINICNDKWLTYCFLMDHNFKTPKTYIDIKEAQRDVLRGTFNYPMILKPRWGMGSIGIYKVYNDQELEVFYKRLVRDIFDSYLKYESKQNLAECVVIQECIDGEEYGLDVVNDLNGGYVNTISKHKVAMRSGETDSAVIVNDINLSDLGSRISSITKHVANLDVDCFKLNNSYYVLEMNARFGGQYPFSHLAGINLPLQIINWLREGETNYQLLTPKKNVRACKDILPVAY